MEIISQSNSDQISYKKLISKTIDKENQLKLNFYLLKSNIIDLISKHSNLI